MFIKPKSPLSVVGDAAVAVSPELEKANEYESKSVTRRSFRLYNSFSAAVFFTDDAIVGKANSFVHSASPLVKSDASHKNSPYG